MTPEQQAAIDAAAARLAAMTAAQQRLTQQPSPLAGNVQSQSGQAGAPLYETLRVNPLGLNGAPPQASQGAQHGVYDPALGAQSLTPPQPPAIQSGAPLTSPDERRGIAATIGHGATFGFLDEIAGLGGGIGALFDPNRSFSQGYDQTRTDVLNDVRRTRSADPSAAQGMEIAGGVLGGIGASSALRGVLGAAPAVTIPGVIGRSVLEGTAYGALYGIGSGNTLAERATGGVVGGATGAGTGLLFGLPLALILRPGMRAAQNAAGQTLREVDDFRIPNDHPLRVQANALYDAMRRGGVVITPDAVNGVAQSMAARARELGVTQSGTPRIFGIVDTFETANPVTRNVSLDELEALRQAIGRIAESGEAGEVRIATAMIRELDNFINNGLNETNVVSANLRPDQVVGFLNEARATWSSVRKADRVAAAFYRAQNAGGSLDNIRTQFRALSNDADFMRGLSDGERDAILSVVRGSPAEGALQMLERMRPNVWGGMPWQTLVGAGVGAGVGEAAGAIGYGTAIGAAVPAAIGGAAGSARRFLRNTNVQAADRLFGSGGVMPPSPRAASPLLGGFATGAAIPGVGGVLGDRRPPPGYLPPLLPALPIPR
jgi:hypothetical protein